jgi:hypothetical protein
MSDRKFAHLAQQLAQSVRRLYRSLTRPFMNWLLRLVLLSMRRRTSIAGFVLPTTIFLVLVAALTTGALSYRAYTTSRATIGDVQNRVIYNAATPAIDRARAKLERLFGNDPRYPGGVPSEQVLLSMLLNDGVNTFTIPGDSATKPNDPYTFADETRVPGQGNTWYYDVDSDGDGTKESTVVYALNFTLPSDQGAQTALQRLITLSDSQKANGETLNGQSVSIARTGPLSNNQASACARRGDPSNPSAAPRQVIEAGWYEDQVNTSILRKRFQVDAFVVKKDPTNTQQPNFVTLEFAQDRQLERANKWGAWFRNDLEIFPGSSFNWNGAMHSEGSMFIGRNFRNYLISATASCLFNPASNSEVSVREKVDGASNVEFTGVIGSAFAPANSYEGGTAMDIYDGTSRFATTVLDTNNDWVTSGTPSEAMLDPVAVQVEDGYRARGGDTTNRTNRIGDPKASNLYAPRRLKLDRDGARPNVDDTYRADDRLGPKPTYGKKGEITIPTGSFGQPIQASSLTAEEKLALSKPASNADQTDVGLDGYWERRARNEGLRIIVGQRLELGNLFGWVAPQDRPNNQDLAAPAVAGDGNPTTLRTNTGAPATLANADIDKSDNPGDPLNPPFNPGRPLSHEDRQRRSLRDNLSAVQAAAIYHYAISPDYPVACYASTAHPGTEFSLRQSINFAPTRFKGGSGGNADIALLSNFFTGRGTDGWEFQPPGGGSATAFANAVAPGQPLNIALQNLANFAGDPLGGFTNKVQDPNNIHPHPQLTMWGNFSNLRQTLETLNTTSYANLSIADKSNLHTAACTLGMLAYNIDRVQQFSPSRADNLSVMGQLATTLELLMDGNVSNGEVLTKDQLATYGYSTATATPNSSNYNPRDYDRVTPEMFIATLRDNLGVGSPENREQYRLAQLIHLKYQIQRDRTYGFRPSPASNTWDYNPFVVGRDNQASNKTTLWSSACDPGIFALYGGSAMSPRDRIASGSFNANARRLLALSRLCGTVLPPGGVRDYPGDGYPARNNDPGRSATLSAYLPTTPDRLLSGTAVKGTVSTAFTQAGTLNTAPYNTPPNFAIPAAETNVSSLLASVAPEFPSLYYLFPEFAHDRIGATGTIDGSFIDHRQPGNPTLSNLPAAFRPWDEPYITNDYIKDRLPAYTFTPVLNTAIPAATSPRIPTYASAVTRSYTGGSINYIAYHTSPVNDKELPSSLIVQPRRPTGAAFPTGTTSGVIEGWVLPTDSPRADARNTSPNRVLPPNGTNRDPGQPIAVPFLDRVLMDGRENQPARVLDMDLGMLRRFRAGTSPAGDPEPWLPLSGLVYAFREDAVREDAIVRPSNGIAPNANGASQTNAQTVNGETDPPLQNGISVKSVDYITDPDRRVHGFRLRNGARVNRHGSLSIPEDENQRGISFFSDNPAYIMGNFNLHEKGGEDARGDRLEEFTTRLFDTDAAYNEAQFYGRTGEDPDFARASNTGDRWRPSEVLADSVTILSETFCDGSLQDLFDSLGTPDPNATVGTAGKYNQNGLYGFGCRNGIATSFVNQNRPETPLTSSGAGAQEWQRENPKDPQSAVKISRLGHPLVAQEVPPLDTTVRKQPVSANYSGTYHQQTADNRTDDRSAPPVGVSPDGENGYRVNSIIVNGIVPSRTNQSYGGLHNFPRMIEKWSGANGDNVQKTLWFAGSFLQLNFSNYATGPYDQESLEPGAGAPTAGEALDYYWPATRRWGYDVGLQLAPAGPVAQRLVSPKTERNEFYTEVPANDPYMNRLCRALPDTIVPDGKCPA